MGQGINFSGKEVMLGNPGLEYLWQKSMLKKLLVLKD